MVGVGEVEGCVDQVNGKKVAGKITIDADQIGLAEGVGR